MMENAISCRSRTEHLALRLRVSHLMHSATLDPPGMPASAILLIRHLADPQPRAFLPYVDAICPGNDWEQATRSRLYDLYRHASRPALGFVSNSCDSVLFADHAELLACLAYDFVHSNVYSSWWWQLISRTLCPGSLQSWISAWLEHPRYIPAALRILSERRAAVEVLSSLSSATAITMLSKVVSEFGLSLITTPSSEFAAKQSALESIPALKQQWDNSAEILSTSPAITSGEAPPWSSLLPVAMVPASLNVPHAALLGVSLSLQYAPEAARSRKFSESLYRWYRSILQRWPESGGPSESGLSPSLAIASEHRTRGEDPLQESDAPRESNHSRTIVMNPYAAEGPADRLQRPGSPEPQSEASEAPQWRGTNTSPEFISDTPDDQLLRTTSRTKNHFALLKPDLLATARPPEIVPSAPQEEPRPQSPEVALRPASEEIRPQVVPLLQPVVTQIGGVLFLINLLRALKLPECMETEFGVEPLDPWALLEALGRCLLGSTHQGLERDPLWKVLAELSGRRVDLPICSGFAGVPGYRLPRFWMSNLGLDATATVGFRLRASRLQLLHSCGIILADLALQQAAPRNVLEAERERVQETLGAFPLTSWRKLFRRPGGLNPLGFAVGTELRRFLAFVLPYIRYRLALGLGTPPNRRFDLSSELLLRTGRLYATTSHLDLMMDISQASGKVRLSGLDADPGWVPAFGRVVRFHYVAERAL